MTLHRWYQVARQWGFDPRAAGNAIRGLPAVLRDRREYMRQSATSDDSDDFQTHFNMFIYGEWGAASGVMKGHYFHQDLLVAQDIFRRNPKNHIDVGSRIDGFVAHVAAFRPITVMDIRPPSAHPPSGVTFKQQDISAPDFFPEERADSVSCLHALEHFGLGRYGDPIRLDGWRQGLSGLRQLLDPGGILYLSVPISRHQRVEFNSQRIFSVPYLQQEFEPYFAIERFDYVDDQGDVHCDLDPYGAPAERSFSTHYGCGIWTLRLLQSNSG